MTTENYPAYWQQQIDDWQASALSGAAYCKQHALSYHKFVYWRRKLTGSENSTEVAPVSAGFARAVATPRMPTALTLSLPGGMAITGFHAGNIDLLAAVLRQL